MVMTLLFTFLLITSLIASFNEVTPFALGAEPITVTNEIELVAAIGTDATTVIALKNDILLSSTLTIETGKTVTLISDKTNGFWKIIGAPNKNTITVTSGGTLVLDGIIVTHNNGDMGRGVYVDNKATLILNSGEISGNNIDTGGIINDANCGGGVYNWGTFTMNGGAISKNLACNGGGVYSIVTFEMNAGTISENTASSDGGGVDNLGTFTVVDGFFYKNMAVNGGGVFNDGIFTLMDGQFLENEALWGSGGGVYNDGPDGVFTLMGGAFSKNKAVVGGGVYNLGVIEMYGGVIGGVTLEDGNIAAEDGGGVCNDGYFSVFNMYDGVIANNTADVGGGVEGGAGVFNMFGGKISDNTAYWGGGVYMWGSFTFNMEGGVLFSNTAYYGGGVFNLDSTFTMSGDAVVLSNRASFGGGIYNDDGTLNIGDPTYSNIVRISDNTAITHGGGLYYTGSNALFNMFGNVVISGNFAGNSGGGVYNTVTFSLLGGGVISGNSAGSRGGGVFNVGVSAIFNMFSNAVISDNLAGIDGGGVFNVNAGVFNMFGGEIISNSAGTGGGGVDTSGEFNMYSGKIAYNTARGAAGVLNYHHFNMFGGEITDNISTGYGGGVENNGSSALGLAIFNMYGDAIIANNTAIYGGGGVYNSDNAIFNMYDVALISNNSAISSISSYGRGGGVHNSNNATLNMFNNAIISDNFALYGGGVFNDFNCTINMVNDSAILNNAATFYGGGVYNWNPYSSEKPSLINMVDRAVISGNVAASYGGGIQSTENSLIRISGEAVISNNSALYGGGVYIMSLLPNAITINGGVIANNSARSGGGIYTNSQLTLTNGIIANNTATVNGGGMYIASAGFVELLAGGQVYGNVAGSYGGGIWVAYENLGHLFVFDGAVFSNNRASVAYSRNPVDDVLYHVQIGVNIIWTTTFTQGYNNYDISYTNGVSLIKHSVIYDVGEGGEGVPIDVNTYYMEETVTVLSDVPTRFGYTFVGWLYNGVIYCGDEMFVMPDVDVVLVAQWESLEVSYVVRYYLWETEFSIAETKIVSGQVVGSVVSLVPDVFEGYSAVDPRSVTLTLNATGNVFTFYYLRVNEYTTWYVVHYYLQDTAERVALDKVVIDKIGAEVTVNALDIAGHTVVNPISLQGVLNATDNVFTFYYTVNTVVEVPTFTVTYDVNGGSGTFVDTNNYHTGDPVTVLSSVPTRVGYTFTGWLYNSVTYNGDETFTMPATNVVLTAQWTANTYTVTYAPGTQGTFTSQVYPSLVYGVNTPTFSGTPTGNSDYTFTGWSPIIANTVTADVTYVAQWTSTGSSGGNGNGNNNGGGSGGGSNGSGGSSKPSSPVAPVVPVEPAKDDPKPTLPGFPPKELVLTWALLNLIISVVGIILVIILTVFAIVWHNKEQKKTQQKEQYPYLSDAKMQSAENDAKETQKRKQRRTLLYVTAVVTGVVGLIVFLLTEDMSRPRAWVDNWTIVNAIIFIIEIIAIAFAFKTKKADKEKPKEREPVTTTKNQ